MAYAKKGPAKKLAAKKPAPAKRAERDVLPQERTPTLTQIETSIARGVVQTVDSFRELSGLW
jgi:hypothetical protein